MSLIRVHPKIKDEFPKAFRAARKSKFRVVRLEDNLVYVARRGKGHERYLVRFTLAQNGEVYVSCRTIDNTPCYGCKFNEMCAHIAVVLLRGKQKATKPERKEAA